MDNSLNEAVAEQPHSRPQEKRNQRVKPTDLDLIRTILRYACGYECAMVLKEVLFEWVELYALSESLREDGVIEGHLFEDDFKVTALGVIFANGGNYPRPQCSMIVPEWLNRPI